MSTNSLTLVAEVVLSVMGNRSDRRLSNLIEPWALRGRGSDQEKVCGFPSRPGVSKLLTEAEYMTATGFAFHTGKRLSLGAGSIYGSIDYGRAVST